MIHCSSMRTPRTVHKLVGTGALQEIAIDGLRRNEVKGLAHARFISELRPEDDFMSRAWAQICRATSTPCIPGRSISTTRSPGRSVNAPGRLRRRQRLRARDRNQGSVGPVTAVQNGGGSDCFRQAGYSYNLLGDGRAAHEGGAQKHVGRGIGNTKPLFTRVFSTDRVRTPVPLAAWCPRLSAPHAQRRTPWRAHRQGCRACPRLPALPGATLGLASAWRCGHAWAG